MATVGLSDERKRGLFNVVFVTSEYLERIEEAWLGIVTMLRCFDTFSSSTKSSHALLA